MSRMFMPTLFILAAALASCGGSSSKPSTVSTSRGPMGSSGSTGSSGPRTVTAPPARSPSRSNRASRPDTSNAGGAFDASTVKVSFLEKSFFGAKSQVVYFIARGSSDRALGQAKACVAQNLGRAPSAYCFAFPSERALRFSRVSRKQPSNMQRPCWIAYWGKPKDRRAIGSASNPAAAPLHCPDATG